MSRIEWAKLFLKNKGLAIPESDQEILKAAYEALKDDDFIVAHEFRLDKDWPEFTKEDWASILELSGKKIVTSNIAGRMTCLRYGLITQADLA